MPQHESLFHCIQGEDIEPLINQIRWKLKAKPKSQLVLTSSLGMSKQAMIKINLTKCSKQTKWLVRYFCYCLFRQIAWWRCSSWSGADISAASSYSFIHSHINSWEAFKAHIKRGGWYYWSAWWAIIYQNLWDIFELNVTHILWRVYANLQRPGHHLLNLRNINNS